MANTNVPLSEQTETIISKMTYLVKSDNGRSRAAKGKVIDKLAEMAYSAHEHLDDQSFENVMGFKKNERS